MPHDTVVKTRRPAASSAYPRVRLFRKIDALRRSRKAVWISAGAGYGKTMLAAGYVHARRTRAIWYSCDAADRDVASFFFHFRSAARKTRLPLLTADYRFGIDAFAREFFRAFFRGVRRPLFIVLDNYQDASNPAFDAVIRQALQETPPHVVFLVLSREAPPAEFERARLEDAIGVIGEAV